MSPRLTLLFALLIVFCLVIRENLTQRPDRLYQLTDGRIDMCLSCHQNERLDSAHDSKVLGCGVCHLGDSLAIDKENAHLNMVNNPGDLRVVEKTCGIEGCHAIDIPKVKNSLMATNRGILATLLYYWGEAEHQNGDFSVEKLIETGETSLAIDYYRKLCATCHLWKQKGDLPGFFGTKGGGCTACHSINPEAPTAVRPWDNIFKGKESEKPHPLITKKVPMENCIRCHNRSGRIGTSYIGIYESEGYGTPYEKGEHSSKRLPGNRYYLDLAPDIHAAKGMTCIDCHTRNEIMGDGTRYAHYEQALEISCTTCHTPGEPGTTRKKDKLNNIAKKGNNFILTSKLDSKDHPLKPPKKGECDYSGHKRLTCESCHSGWTPQCYGCHVKRDMSETHLDKLTLKETPGMWDEGRSYLRYERPMLAVWNNEVVIVTPGCQDIVTLLDKLGKPAGGFNSLTMAAINPHTTQKQGRTCADCHTSTKTIGLGQGTAWFADGRWHFKSVDQGVATPSGKTPPLDAFVTIDGKPLQKKSRADLRPFNKEEIARILRVGRCLPCHKTYDDPAFSAYSLDKKCPKFKE